MQYCRYGVTMMKKKRVVKKPHGERMIKFNVHFWTNDLPDGAHDKMCWNSCVIHTKPNKTRKIGNDQIHINLKDDEDFGETFLKGFGELMRRNGIEMVDGSKPAIPNVVGPFGDRK